MARGRPQAQDAAAPFGACLFVLDKLAGAQGLERRRKRSQALYAWAQPSRRLPKEFHFEGTEVRVSKIGDKVILEPMKKPSRCAHGSCEGLRDNALAHPHRYPRSEASKPICFFQIRRGQFCSVDRLQSFQKCPVAIPQLLRTVT
jgi:virulence-associated protein VagC